MSAVPGMPVVPGTPAILDADKMSAVPGMPAVPGMSAVPGTPASGPHSGPDRRSRQCALVSGAAHWQPGVGWIILLIRSFHILRVPAVQSFMPPTSRPRHPGSSSAIIRRPTRKNPETDMLRYAPLFLALLAWPAFGDE